jgi:hypothetical protein
MKWTRNLRGSLKRYPQVDASFAYLIYSTVSFLAMKIRVCHRPTLKKYLDYAPIRIDYAVKSDCSERA